MKLFFIIKNKKTQKKRIINMSDYAIIDCVDIYRFWRLLDIFETKVRLVDDNSHYAKAYELQNLQENSEPILTLNDLSKTTKKKEQ